MVGLGIAPVSFKVRNGCAQRRQMHTCPPLNAGICLSSIFLSQAERNCLQPASFPCWDFQMSEFNELQEAKGELQRRRNILRILVTKYDGLLSSSSPDSEEVLKARVGVAEARVGVAEAEFDEAKAKLRAAEANGALEAIAKARVGIVEARVGVAEARVGVAEAKYDVAEAAGSNLQKLERLQGEIVAKRAKCNELEGQFSSLDWGGFSFVDVYVHTLVHV